MSARTNGYIVTLKKSISEDYSKRIKDAILMMKEVVSVEAVEENIESHMAEQRVKVDIAEQLYGVLYPKNK